jgi:hypothetical protein
MRMIRATATKTRVLMWNNTFPTIFRSGLILPLLPSAYLYLMPMLFSCESLSIWVPMRSYKCERINNNYSYGHTEMN